jgi:prevent-host-death family protein
MMTVGLTHAKAHLGELLDKVDAGEEVLITRRGRPVARMSAVAVQRPRKPLPLDDLAAFRATLPMMQESSAGLIRKMRDEGY